MREPCMECGAIIPVALNRGTDSEPRFTCSACECEHTYNFGIAQRRTLGDPDGGFENVVKVFESNRTIYD